MTKKNLRILIIGVLLIASVIAIITKNSTSPGSNESGTSSITSTHALSLKVFEIDEGWGYDIFIDSNLFISQENIPGTAGHLKFISEEEAMLCGELVIKKLKQNELPTISKDELDSLGISR